MAANFNVQNQRQVRYWDDTAQRLVDGMEITFAIGEGQTGSIRLPVAQATPDNVRALIEARVEQMHAIANL